MVSKRDVGGAKTPETKRSDLAKLIQRIVVHADRLEIELKTDAIAKRLGVKSTDPATNDITHIVRCRIKRSGLAMRLIDDSGALSNKADVPDWLVGLLARAHRWWGELAEGEIDIANLSKQENVTASNMTRVVRLVFLSPKVVEAMLRGEARAGLSSKALLAPEAVCAEWAAQEKRFLQA